MEVTKNNFKESLPLIQTSIDKADFLVIDTEFTGLKNGRDVSIFDSPEEYYTTLLHGCSDFLLIQYGLSAFYWDEVNNKYMNETYNFYLFPRGRPDRNFLCQSSSLDFLAAQGFDFNKLIREGISYMTEPIETRLRENLTERQKTHASDKASIPIPEEHKQQIDDICKRVREFLDNNKAEDMEIDRCNAFIRRLLFQELGARFKNEAFVETKILENKNRVLKVSRLKSENDSKARDTQKREKEWEEFEDSVGFSKVARMISQSEKLVIGHNMLLDVLHTLNHFFQPLPSDYSSFKEFAHCMFPRILDTKYMSSLPPFKDKMSSTVLQHLFAALSEAPFILPVADSENGRGYNKMDDKHHEAGYDAYVTGLCFLAMHGHLSRMRGEDHTRVSSTDSAVLKPFINKLFLAKTAHYESPYMNLAGVDPKPSRDHVFHVTFPKEWQRSDINQLFSPFGGVVVQFLDDTSAVVGLMRRDQARDVIRALSSNSRISLMPYSTFKQPNKTQHPSALRSSLAALRSINTPDARMRQVNTNTVLSMTTPPSPDKSFRARSHSASASAPPQTGRKRTSSGVFQIDDMEPPTKRLETPKAEVPQKKQNTITNGKRKNEEKDKDTKNKEKEKVGKAEKSEKKEIVKKFDSAAKSTCVSAFKESDTWD